MTKYWKQTGRGFDSHQLHKCYMKKFYYERSNLLESEVNVHFEDVLWMSMEDTIAWIDKLREFILDEWDNKGTPPTIGLNTDDIIKNF